MVQNEEGIKCNLTFNHDFQLSIESVSGDASVEIESALFKVIST